MSFLILSIYLSYPFKNLSYICALDEDILKLLTVFTNLGFVDCVYLCFLSVSWNNHGTNDFKSYNVPDKNFLEKNFLNSFVKSFLCNVTYFAKNQVLTL